MASAECGKRRVHALRVRAAVPSTPKTREERLVREHKSGNSTSTVCTMDFRYNRHDRLFAQLAPQLSELGIDPAHHRLQPRKGKFRGPSHPSHAWHMSSSLPALPKPQPLRNNGSPSREAALPSGRHFGLSASSEEFRTTTGNERLAAIELWLSEQLHTNASPAPSRTRAEASLVALRSLSHLPGLLSPVLARLHVELSHSIMAPSQASSIATGNEAAAPTATPATAPASPALDPAFAMLGKCFFEVVDDMKVASNPNAPLCPSSHVHASCRMPGVHPGL